MIYITIYCRSLIVLEVDDVLILKVEGIMKFFCHLNEARNEEIYGRTGLR